jgi:hypothetical protein
MRRWRVVVMVIWITSIAWLAATRAEQGTELQVLTVADGMPRDFEHLARDTWQGFMDAFPARRGCLDPVTVDAAWSLDDRAAYDPGRRLVTVRIPGTAPNLQASLVHEFAHHLEFTCSAHRTLRPRFLRAQGLSPGASWFKGEAWELTPSEQFAEAATEYVLGRRPSHSRTAVSKAALRVVSDWAAGT